MEFLKREGELLALLALFLAAIGLPRWIELSRVEIYILLLAGLMIYMVRQMRRDMKEIRDEIRLLGTSINERIDKLLPPTSHNPNSSSRLPAKPPTPPRPPSETTGKGAVGGGLIGGGIGFLLGGPPGGILGAIIGAIIANQIESNERSQPPRR